MKRFNYRKLPLIGALATLPGSLLLGAQYELSSNSGYNKLNAAGLGLNFSIIGRGGESSPTPSTRGWGLVEYDYSVSQTELSWAQYAVFLRDTGYNAYMFSSTQAPYIGLSRGSDGTIFVRSGVADKAVCVVRYSDVIAFSNWLSTGNVNESGIFRLPSVDEWYKAAYYDPNRYGVGQGGYWLYGTGADSLQQGDAFYGYLSIAPTSSAWPEVDFGKANAFGLYGMTGGVEEWTSTPQNTANTRHWVMGGSWGLTEAQLTNARVNNSSDSSANDKLGFRLASSELPMTAVPEASTYSLVSGFGACLLVAFRRLRRRGPKQEKLRAK